MKLDKDVMARLRTNPDFQKVMEGLNGYVDDVTLATIMSPPDKLPLSQGMARAAVLIRNTLRDT